jgi:hypothetical protein
LRREGIARETNDRRHESPSGRFVPILYLSGNRHLEVSMKKFLGIFALLGALAGAAMFWRKRQDDDEFLDEELD